LSHRLQFQLAGRPPRLLAVGLYLVAAAVDHVDAGEIATKPGIRRARAPIDGAVRLGHGAVAPRDAAPDPQRLTLAVAPATTATTHLAGAFAAPGDPLLGGLLAALERALTADLEAAGRPPGHQVHGAAHHPVLLLVIQIAGAVHVVLDGAVAAVAVRRREVAVDQLAGVGHELVADVPQRRVVPVRDLVSHAPQRPGCLGELHGHRGFLVNEAEAGRLLRLRARLLDGLDGALLIAGVLLVGVLGDGLRRVARAALHGIEFLHPHRILLGAVPGFHDLLVVAVQLAEGLRLDARAVLAE